MVVKNNSASLIIQSDASSAALVTVALGIHPTAAHEIGDLTDPEGKRPAGSKAPAHWRYSTWHYTVKIDEAVGGPDSTGTTSLRQLLGVLEGKSAALHALRDRYSTRISWGGFSDSGQGGFVVDADLFAPLAELRCDLYGTVYLSEDEESS